MNRYHLKLGWKMLANGCVDCAQEQVEGLEGEHGRTYNIGEGGVGHGGLSKPCVGGQLVKWRRED
jgi:hypothetical protein